MKESENIYIAAFHEYQSLGLDPLPIPPQNGNPAKGPSDPGWQIIAANGAYTEADFAAPCNIGILLGGPKNLTDIDCDSPESIAVAKEIMDAFAKRVGKTMAFGRPSKRWSHYIFECDKSQISEKITDPTDDQCIVEYRCTNKKGERGLQTVFPPSQNYNPKTGKIEQVSVEPDSAGNCAKVQATELHMCFQMIAATALLAKHFPVESQRHNTILALAGVFARSGMKMEKAVGIIDLCYRQSHGYNGDHRKAISDTEGVFRDHERRPNTHLYGYPTLTEIMPKAVVDRVLELLGIDKPEGTLYALNDAGNGQRLVDKHGQNIRYCVDDQCWYVWDGKRWRIDEIQKLREFVKGIAEDIRQEAQSLRPPQQTADPKVQEHFESRKRELLKWANQSGNADRVSKAITSAQSDPRVTCFRSDFDKDLHLLNCVNGVVDLHSGVIIPHDRTFMMSKLCPTAYDRSATDSIWDKSLAAFARNHGDLMPFLKRAAGYSIQGDKTEEKIFVLFGPGNAGKGTFIDWLSDALGQDYVCAISADSVMRQKRNSAAASGDLARLEGTRLVIVSEIEKGNKVQEAFLKQASGNDQIVARGLYKSERQFRSTFQFWFQTNYRPGFDSTDSGNRRRYVEIPFDNVLANDPLVKFDSGLKNRMRRDAGFLKAVLAWVVAGCVEWRQQGLGIPPSVEAATNALFAHNDFMREFLNDRCVADPNERVSVKKLRTDYESWCEEQGEEPAQGRTFNRMLEERGFERKQAKLHGVSCKAWVGIRLKEHDELSRNLLNHGPDGQQADAPLGKQFSERRSTLSTVSRVMKVG